MLFSVGVRNYSSPFQLMGCKLINLFKNVFKKLPFSAIYWVKLQDIDKKVIGFLSPDAAVDVVG